MNDLCIQNENNNDYDDVDGSADADHDYYRSILDHETQVKPMMIMLILASC